MIVKLLQYRPQDQGEIKKLGWNSQNFMRQSYVIFRDKDSGALTTKAKDKNVMIANMIRHQGPYSQHFIFFETYESVQ